MKKALAIILTFLLLFCGCGNESEPGGGKTGGWLLTESEIETEKKNAGNEPEKPFHHI